MIRLPDGRLVLDLVGSIAEVLGVSPRFLYFLSNHIEENYKITKIPKKNGKFRTIEAPSERLKYVQSQILERILPTEVSTIATAFDDITISGNLDKMKIEFLVRTCRELLRQKGLRINYRKVRILRRNARQEVTGVVVNERPSVPRHVRRELRQRMYYLRHYGLIGHEPVIRQGLQSLLGSVGFVNYIEPRNVEFRQYAEQLKRYLKERP